MARPRTFEIDEALDSAIGVFWDHGYEATSMADLMTAMGLQKGSIYKAWKDKRALFQAALRRYLEQGYERLQALAAGDPEAALQALLAHFRGACTKGNRGCLAMNTTVELGPHDARAVKLLAAHHARVVGLFADVIRRGQTAGAFRKDRSAQDLAQFVLVVVTGMLTRSREALTAEQARRSADLALEALR
jgi:TetR/AcrR family transcriptional regulator, transcriptional repressor for nem operon